MTLEIYQLHAHVSKQAILKQSYTYCMYSVFYVEDKNIKIAQDDWLPAEDVCLVRTAL